VHTQREPLLGVITAITPFNHPMNQVAHKVVPAVATNNRMVLKPTEKVPLAALLFADILYEAGLPPEMLSVITGDPKEIADEMLTTRAVDLVTFTGGVAIGKYIAAKAGYRRMVLELGGNDPIIVMDDADLDEASRPGGAGQLQEQGQRCTAVKRMLVHREVRRASPTWWWTRPAPGSTATRRPEVDMGTVIDEPPRGCSSAVDEAVAQGARCWPATSATARCTPHGDRPRAKGEMTVVQEETFGPVSPIIGFGHRRRHRHQQRHRLRPELGVCTNRLDDITRFVNELQVGTVNVREVPGYRLELTPFGGIKDSGTGLQGRCAGSCKSFTNVKTYSLPW
jgi:acyl-CoA reductase-like NAD-dependent aldehyde dehydrogenase